MEKNLIKRIFNYIEELYGLAEENVLIDSKMFIELKGGKEKWNKNIC